MIRKIPLTLKRTVRTNGRLLRNMNLQTVTVTICCITRREGRDFGIHKFSISVMIEPYVGSFGLPRNINLSHLRDN